MTKRKTTKQFISNAISIHGDKFDYSCVNYTNTHTKVTIICHRHGQFTQRPNRHLAGDGCPQCALKESSINKTKSTEQFIKEATKIHDNKYDYSHVSYKNGSTKVLLGCPTHGHFLQTPSDHLFAQSGCPVCGNIGKSINKTKSTEQFIKEATKIHDNKYDYSQTDYTGNTNHIIVLCRTHGAFKVTPSNHLSRRSGCPKCFSSKGEDDIRILLRELSLTFTEQKTFETCRNPETGYKLRYDFYVPDKNLLIEYDGPQHFSPTPIKGIKQVKENFVKLCKRDKIKDEFAKRENIKLVRIPYFDTNLKTTLINALNKQQL